MLPDNIARMYGKWMRSPPFDIGRTTRNALNTVRFEGVPNPSQVCTTQSAKVNQNSISNGSTMRMAPLAVYLSKMEDPADVQRAIKIDTNHTHSNRIVEDCNFAIAMCVRSLIRGEGALTAYAIAREICSQFTTEVKEWFSDMEAGKLQPPHLNIGWVKIAFQQSFKYLKREDLSYDQIMHELLIQGGDTDTNAAIVGMVIGARDGFSKLDPNQVDKVSNYRNSLGGHKRPGFLIPGKGMLKKLDFFLRNIPSKLLVAYDKDAAN